MESLQFLHYFISRQSDDEKAVALFKLGSNGTEPQSFILYNLLDQQKEFDEEKISYAWRTYNKTKPFTLKALENAKSRLKYFLLDSFAMAHIFEVGGESEKALYYAEAYIQKGLPLEAWQKLQSTLNDDQIFLIPEFKLKIVQKLLWLLPLIQIEAPAVRREELLIQFQATTEEMDLFREVFLFNNEVADLNSRSVIMKSDDSMQELKKFRKNRLLELHPEKLPHLIATYLLKTRSLLAYLSGDVEMQFQNQFNLCAELRKYEAQYLHSSLYLNYISEYINLATLCSHLNQEKILDEITIYLNGILPVNKTYQPVFDAQLCLIRVLRFYYINELEDQEKLLFEADRKIAAVIEYAPLVFADNFRLGLMKCWLVLKNYERVKYWFGNRTHVKALVRRDSHFIIYLIYLCSLYEQFKINKGNKIELNEGYGIWSRNLKSMFTLSKLFLPLENAVIDAFMKVGDTNDGKNHLQLWTSLSKKLSKLPVDGEIYQEQFYRIFNLRQWVEKMIVQLRTI